MLGANMKGTTLQAALDAAVANVMSKLTHEQCARLIVQTEIDLDFTVSKFDWMETEISEAILAISDTLNVR